MTCRITVTVNGGAVDSRAAEGLYKGEVVYRSDSDEDDRTIFLAYSNAPAGEGRDEILPQTGMERRVVAAALLAFRATGEDTAQRRVMKLDSDDDFGGPSSDTRHQDLWEEGEPPAEPFMGYTPGEDTKPSRRSRPVGRPQARNSVVSAYDRMHQP